MQHNSLITQLHFRISLEKLTEMATQFSYPVFHPLTTMQLKKKKEKQQIFLFILFAIYIFFFNHNAFFTSTPKLQHKNLHWYHQQDLFCPFIQRDKVVIPQRKLSST